MDNYESLDTADKCYKMFQKSGKVGYFMLYNALKEQENKER